ncbi:hypothetical protein J7K03_01555 [bacterium]|nr:hypothetical protein [bacterium]
MKDVSKKFEELLGKEVFIKWEGDIFKVRTKDLRAFKLSGNSWKPVSGKLVATLFFEGRPVKKP